MAVLIVSLSVVYALLALFAAAAAARARGVEHAAEADAVIIVAARNEEETLPGCLEALARQQFPGGRLRILVVDDQSEDGTAAAARRFAPQVEYLRVTDETHLRGKAAAIHAAVESSSEEIILLTDADCRPPAGWAHNMAAQLQDRNSGVVSGVTAVDVADAESPLLARVEALDWTLLLTFAAGLSGAGLPLTAMGNNMAFRREAYEDVGGYPALAESVTEDYALFQAIRRAGWDARLLLDARLENITLPLSNLRRVFAQRKRWARGGVRTTPGVYLVYLIVWMTHVAILLGIVLAPAAGWAALAVKFAADVVLLAVGTGELRQRGLWSAFPAFEIYIFAYLSALPVSLLVAPRVTWRGRRY